MPHSSQEPPHNATGTPSPASALAQIGRRLSDALREAGRRGAAPEITAVSKKHGGERIRMALAAGHRTFGENRVQEAQQKWPALLADYPDVDLRLIGPLQTNKVRDAVRLFTAIESVDRLKLAGALAAEFEKAGVTRSLFVQVNTGEEDQKSGVPPLEADGFIQECRQALGLRIDGLMCIPPAGDPPAPHFALLAAIAKRNQVAGLSMGMSGDYEIAAQLGATRVRIGTEIFGPRPDPGR